MRQNAKYLIETLQAAQEVARRVGPLLAKCDGQSLKNYRDATYALAKLEVTLREMEEEIRSETA